MVTVWIAVGAAIAVSAVGGFAFGYFCRRGPDPQIQERLVRYCMR